MPRRRTPPSQTWRTFLKNHLGSTVAIDFFAVPTLTCRILFVFVVLAHDRRRILHVNVTEHPTSAWTRQQLREAFPNDPNARFLLHDRDTTFDAAFGRAVEAFGLTAVRTAPRSPWQNPYVERVRGEFQIPEHSQPRRELGSIVRCPIWSSCFCICWRHSPGSPVPAAPVPWWRNRCSSSTNC